MRILKNIVLATIVAAVLPTLVSAIEPCNQIVVDEAGILNDISAIEAAARRLEAEGAVVRVRVTQTFAPYGRTLEKAANAVCDSWGGPGGVVPANYIIYWASMNEKALGVYRGDIWKDELPETFTDSLVKKGRGKMSLAFAGRQFDQAFIIGINETIKRVTAPIVAPPASQPKVNAPVHVIERIEVRQPAAPREPFNWTPVGYGLGGLLILLVLALVTRYALQTWAMRARADASRRKSYGAFKRLQETYDRLLADFGEGENLKPHPDWTNAYRWALWRTEFDQIATEAAGDNTHFRSSEQDHSSKYAPLKQVGTYDEFLNIRKEFDAIHSRLEASHDKMVALESAIEEERRLAGALTVSLQAARLELDACKKVINAIRNQGFIVTEQLKSHEEADRIYQEAQECFSGKQYQLAEQNRTEALALATAAMQAVRKLPDTKTELTAQIKACDELREHLLARIPDTKDTFKAMKELYADSSLEDVAGNGTEAEKRLSSVPEMITSISALLSNQKWEQAAAALEGVGRVLGKAESLIDSIGELKTSLQQSARLAHEEVDEAAVSVEKARQYLRQMPKHDNEKRRAKLAEAVRLIRRVRHELAKDRPDYPIALADAIKADDIADAVYDGAREAEAELQRQRQLAETKRLAVLAKIEKAQRYRRNRRSDIDDDTEQGIVQVYNQRGSIAEGVDALSVLALIEQMEKDIDSHHKDAKDQVAAAERKRAAKRRAEEAAEAAAAAAAHQNDDSDIFGSGVTGSTGSWGSHGSSGGGVSGSTGGW